MLKDHTPCSIWMITLLLLALAQCTAGALVLTPGDIAAALVLTPGDIVFVLHPSDVGFSAPTPLSLAMHDVQSDFYKVLGRPPIVYTTDTLADQPQLIANITGKSILIFFGRAARSAAGKSFSLSQSQAKEEHAIIPSTTSNTNPVTSIICVGAPGRGEVFAAYSFSERVLGVEPLYFFTDKEPSFSKSLSFASASALAYNSGTPTFEWRGFFTNDEDLLGGFSMDPLGKSVFSSKTWDRVMEALLRTKGNVLLCGTVSFPDEDVYALAQRRGIVTTTQHFTLLGTNTWRWPEGIPYSADKNPTIQNYVWEANIAAAGNRESLWTVGYRGLNDYPFWLDEPEFNTTASRCKLISQAMETQVKLIRKVPHRKNDQCVTFLWSEMLDLYKSGLLILPTNTTKIFADENGSGSFDPIVKELLQEGDGVYYHVQMESPGNEAQLTEMVPPSIFFDNLRSFVNKKATKYFMLNLSDLKPATFLVDVVMKFLWNATKYNTKTTADAYHMQKEVIQSWSVRHYSDGLQNYNYSVEVASIMEQYFAVEYIAANTTERSKRYGDEHLSGLLRTLM